MIETGACRFCGQIRQVEIPDGCEKNPQTVADNIATAECRCKESQEYRHEIDRREKIRRSIEDIFREEPEQADFVLAAAHAVMSGTIMKCSIDIGEMKYTFYMKGEKLIFGRKKTLKSREEF